MRRLLTDAGIEPSKGLGQNFVIDPGTIDRIVLAAAVEEGDRVIEVGPGVGSLTLGLLDAGARVTAVEIDHRLVDLLEREIDDATLRVVQADALAVDWPSLLSDAPSWTLVANLPYNVATVLILDLLENVAAIDRMLVMMQREPAERLAASPGERTSSATTVKRAWFADARVVGAIGRSVFLPRPNVDSALVEITRRREPDGDRRWAFELIERAFGQRRKMLRRSLADVVDRAAFDAAGVEPTSRPEALTLDGWVALAASSQGAAR